MSSSALTEMPIEYKSLKEFTEKAYLDYSMYVVLDRALPNIADGLKPVQRRIVYAMSELNLAHTAKFKKSARTVGDVLGKFHPHGDGACYEAMVLMAQDFSYRYPLVDGQGNWGSPDDPKSFAAMRYTEARLSAYAETLLAELEQGTVHWIPNFDGTMEEPALLPARLPNILLNGAMGIAVGMSTDIPPHNLREVVNACVHLLDHPKATLEEVCEFVAGPDYPTHAEIITSKEDLLELYRTGNGSIKMRATYSMEDDEIVINALPHQVSGAKILEQIAQQMHDKKLPQLVDLRDESDHEHPLRLVLVPRSNRIDVDELMSHLFATTELEKSYRANFNMIGLNGKPQTKNLKLLLTEWLSFRSDTVKKRLQFRLDKVLSRLHILDGLLIAYLNLDEVIRIIRHEDEPKQELMKKFHLTEIQADAILDLKLRYLARLEEMKIRGEQADLSKERDQIEKTLGSEKELKKLIRKELLADAERHGDVRKSPIVKRAEAQVIKEEARIPNEPITLILSEKGWVRAAKGHEIDVEKLSFKAGDQLRSIIYGRSNQQAVFVDSTGRSYSLPAHSLPSARGQGEPLTGKLNLPPQAEFIAALMGEPDDFYLFASESGYGFITSLKELYSKNKNGKVVMTLGDKNELLVPTLIPAIEKHYIAVISNQARLLIFPADSLPMLAKGKGNKMIQLTDAKAKGGDEVMLVIVCLTKKDSLVVKSGKKQLVLKPQDWKVFMGERGRRGQKLPNAFQRVSALLVKSEKE